MANTGTREVQYEGLRERAARFGLDSLGDEDTLALFLSRTVHSGARTWAQVLLAEWGGLSAVLSADTADLARIVGGAAAVELGLLQEVALRVAASSLAGRDVISSWDALVRYLRVRLAGRGREEFRVLFLDKRNRLILDEMMGEGTVDHAPVYPREVVRRALQLNASALILVHNHPSGDQNPSRADVRVTDEVISACNSLQIVVHDHVLVAGEAVTSFKAAGLLRSPDKT